jgi:isoleucyl-tRNA synthetase
MSDQGTTTTTDKMASITISSAAAGGTAATALSTTGAGNNNNNNKSTVKRDALRENEIAVQALWKEQKAFESNPDSSMESFLVTFPYPYSNGHLHIGHAFSLTKAVFRAQYERHVGKNVLFPFAFHCTGMPIQAVRTWSSLNVD